MTQYSKLERLEQAIIVEKAEQKKLAAYERYVQNAFKPEDAIDFAAAYFDWKTQIDLLKDMQS
jgi:hypothetical protein